MVNNRINYKIVKINYKLLKGFRGKKVICRASIIEFASPM